jgi:hypothetical protein
MPLPPAGECFAKQLPIQVFVNKPTVLHIPPLFGSRWIVAIQIFSNRPSIITNSPLIWYIFVPVHHRRPPAAAADALRAAIRRLILHPLKPHATAGRLEPAQQLRPAVVLCILCRMMPGRTALHLCSPTTSTSGRQWHIFAAAATAWGGGGGGLWWSQVGGNRAEHAHRRFRTCSVYYFGFWTFWILERGGLSQHF